MFLWLARIYAFCFIIRIVEPLFPSLKKTKFYEFVVAATEPFYQLLKETLKETLPVKEEHLRFWIHGICIAGVLLIGRIIDFII